MAKRAVKTTQDYLVNAALPEATETYTVIPHGAIINKVKSALQAKGLEIERELYRCNDGAQVAQGIYHLKYGSDDDIGMLFAWSNSYDKSMRFKCSIGGYVHKSLASIISGNMGNFGRKHTGSADQEAFDTIDEHIDNATTYFDRLVADKDVMKNLVVSEQIRAEFMGQIYFVNELVTGEHLSMIKQEFKKPSFKYNGVENSVWSMYNSIVYVLQRAHPRHWMDQQKMVHYLMCKRFNIESGILSAAQPDSISTELNQEVDSRQMNMLDLFAEAEQEIKPSVQEIVESLNNIEIPTSNLENFMPDTSQDVMVEEDMEWQCLKCGEMQAGDAIFYDGQICHKCFNS